VQGQASQQARLAVTLALVAGSIDAIGVLTLAGLFTAHMSGNTARLGVALASGDLRAAAPLAAAVALFLAWVAAGAVLAAALEQHVPRHRTAALLAVEAAMLGVLLLAGALLAGNGHVASRHGARFYVLAAAAIGAMGVQASALSRVGEQPVRTTYISGLLTNLAHQTVARVRGDRRRGRHVGLLAAVALAYLTGATAGGVLEMHLRLWAAAAPALVLLITAASCGPER
jgi:uncharacterized membrane protein YoaK (UPF0700 family)